MKEFFVGICVLLMVGLLSLAGMLLFPVLLLMGIFFRLLVALFFILFVIWLVGKVTLLLLESLRKRDL